MSKHLWECDVPLLVCRSIGFLGYIRLQIREHTVIEAHPDNESPDLRVDKPWPALQDYLDSINIEQLDQKERSHVPPLVILYYYLKKYKDSHDGEWLPSCATCADCDFIGSLPGKRCEKERLKQMIKDSGHSEEGNDRFLLEENFEQAVHYANTCVTPRPISKHVKVRQIYSGLN